MYFISTVMSSQYRIDGCPCNQLVCKICCVISHVQGKLARWLQATKDLFQAFMQSPTYVVINYHIGAFISSMHAHQRFTFTTDDATVLTPRYLLAM